MDKKTERVLALFEEINSIPRKSKHEEEISEWLCKWAIESGFEVERDEFMDVLIRVPATAGYEERDTVVFQGHMDMVCEKTPESNHNFLTDAIQMYIEDGWLKAKDTSLGADNGIALAIAMALVTDEEVKHPPVELLFTVDEETGLTGAVNLPTNWLSGKKLINIDSEDEGVFTIGCAGGRDAQIHLKRELEDDSALDKLLSIEVGGLKGGHSGVEIHLEKGNANILLVRVLKHIKESNISFGIAEFHGGSAHNAIPREASVEIMINASDKKKILPIVEEMEDIFKKEYQSVEPSLFIQTQELEGSKAFDKGPIVELLLALPHGVLYNSQEMHGVVETSSNLAVVNSKGSEYYILMSQRSSVMSRLDEICEKIDAVVSLTGASVEFGGGYPAWQPDFNSSILEEFKASYRGLFQKEPIIEVIHAGLECGVIGAKYPGMEMISIGPTIKSPHCPDERLDVSTIKMIWDLLVTYLK